jgi:hypothetical protein
MAVRTPERVPINKNRVAKAPNPKKPATLRTKPGGGSSAGAPAPVRTAPRPSNPLLALGGFNDPSRDSKSLLDAATRAQGTSTNPNHRTDQSRLRNTTDGREGEAVRAIGEGARSDFKGNGRHKSDGSGSFGFKRGEVSLPSGPGEGSISDGSVSREAIRRVILANIGALRACYQTGLRTNPRIEGKITLHWEVSTGGRVTTSRLDADTPEMKAVGECVRLRLQAWTFPEPPHGSRYSVDYPFRFSSL